MPTATIQYLGELRTQCTHDQSGDVIVTDAPTDNHGKGEAFSPTDLLSTSLASCMITTMAIKAAIQSIPFGAARAEMVKTMSSDPRRVSGVRITIQMPKEDYSDQDKEFLEETARNCPVAQSLNPGVNQEIEFRY